MRCGLIAQVILVLLGFPAVLRAGGDPVVDLSDSMNRFALDLYPRAGDPNANLIFSPFSVHLALDVAAAGARGETLGQMQKVLRVEGQDSSVAAATGSLMDELQSAGGEGKPVLKVANALWAQKGLNWNADYFELVGKDFRAGLDTVDFHDAEHARGEINQWVASQTNDKIKELLGKGAIVPGVTRLVITNAVYFKGDWEDPFSANSTSEAPFHALGKEETVETEMMRQTAPVKYMENDSLQAIEMPYVGENVSMLILLPKGIDGLAKLEASLNEQTLAEVDRGLSRQRVVISLPKFTFAKTLDLAAVLGGMGMKDAFDSKMADFSGMDGMRDLYVTGVVHQAFVAVDEKGTEAAAATGITVGASAIMLPPPVRFDADHPFVFLIRDKETGLILFMGRVVDPKE
jgi:serpin B